MANGMIVCERGVRAPRQKYAMYVWTDGFDKGVSGCGLSEFLAWDSRGPCFTHTWNTAEKRAWLWNTCNLPGREVSAIFVSDVHHNLKRAKETGDCSSADISTVRLMLSEGHSQVPNLKIYGLYAVSDLAVSERSLVQYIVHYNDHCARNPNERFDGVAVNNEAYAGIKCKSDAERTQYLHALAEITLEAGKQTNGRLLTHYSMGWHWGICDGAPSDITWRGNTYNANHHMIDIFDSTDVQVGYIIHPQIADRMRHAGYDHALAAGKPIYTTVYTNRATSLCQTSFFPDNTCHVHGHSEAAMFERFDDFSNNGIAHALPCIHYFRGIYSAGAHPDWPSHHSGHSPIIG
ncbi:uncharacterized protein LOC128232447 isoform X2 [Mya arenaria]|nr:uncharacterized protein LOC128232447 isoform X2 [Mya arenaria]XP_052801957.1 uncharacterized protein LOC128232447 isoform X2 [Mya arenaria]